MLKKQMIVIVFFILLNNLFSVELLTLDTYLKIIEEKLPDIKKSEINVKKSKNNIDSSYSQFDVNLTSGFTGLGVSTKDSFDSVLKIENRPDYINGFSGNVGLSTKLLSGTQLSVTGNYSQKFISGEIENSMTHTITSYKNISCDPGLSISLSQPLLYNWFGFIDRYSVSNAKNSYKIELLKNDLTMKSSLNYYNKLYLKWIEIIKLKNLLKSTVDSAMIFESQTKDKLNLGLVENDGYQNAKYSLLTYQEQYRTILYNYENIKNELNLFLDIENFEPDNNTTDNVLLKIFSKEYKEISFNDTRNFLILNLNKENLESLKKVKENQSLPHLDFFGKADIKFNSLLNVDDDYSSKNSDPSIDFQVGLQFNYPLIGLNTKSAKKEINLSIDLLLKEYEITENTYKKNVNTLTNSQLYLKQVIDYKNQSLDTLRKRAMIEETKFKQGRITLKELIDTRNLIINGQISIIQTQTNIILNDIDYDYITK